MSNPFHAQNECFHSEIPLHLLTLSRHQPHWTLFLTRLSELWGPEIHLRWVETPKQALETLGEIRVDAVVIGELGDSWSHSAATLREIVLAFQTLDSPTVLVALLPVPDDQLQAELLARRCTVCVSPRMWDSPILPLVLVQALADQQCRLELQRLSTAHQRRLQRDQSDVAALLRLQQDLIESLQEAPSTGSSRWEKRYDGLLRSAILSGPQPYASEIAALVSELATRRFSPRDVLAWHVHRLQAVTADSWGRVSPHLLARANLLALEVLAQLGEQYRQLESISRQHDLPCSS